MRDDLRKEEICLNCGTTVNDNYCPHCGQENRASRESFGDLMYHFFSDFTHFDSRLFKTIKYLVVKPGFLTKEYLAGKRKRYFHPIRMYIFISFVFFLFMGLLSSHENHGTDVDDNTVTAEIRNTLLDSLKSDSQKDAVTFNAKESHFKGPIDIGVINNYASVEVYDSIQNTLPPDEQAGKLNRYIVRKYIQWKQKYPTQFFEIITERFLHAIPKAMFLLLPLFAVFLKWFYSKDYFYVDHAIFSLHFHSFAFLLMLSAMVTGYFLNRTSLGYYNILILFIYLVAALYNIYHQSLVRSFFKGIAVSMLYALTIGVVLGIAGILIFISI